MKKFFGIVTLVSWSLLACICQAFPNTVPTGIYETLFGTLIMVGITSPLIWLACKKPGVEDTMKEMFTVIKLLGIVGLVIGLMVGIIYIVTSIVGFAIGLLPDFVIAILFVFWILPMILKDIGRHIGKGIAESIKDKE